MAILTYISYNKFINKMSHFVKQQMTLNAVGANDPYLWALQTFWHHPKDHDTAPNLVSRKAVGHPSNEPKHAIGANTFDTLSAMWTSWMELRSCSSAPTNVWTSTRCRSFARKRRPTWTWIRICWRRATRVKMVKNYTLNLIGILLMI